MYSGKTLLSLGGNFQTWDTMLVSAYSACARTKPTLSLSTETMYGTSRSRRISSQHSHASRAMSEIAMSLHRGQSTCRKQAHSTSNTTTRLSRFPLAAGASPSPPPAGEGAVAPSSPWSPPPAPPAGADAPEPTIGSGRGAPDDDVPSSAWSSSSVSRSSSSSASSSPPPPPPPPLPPGTTHRGWAAAAAVAAAAPPRAAASAVVLPGDRRSPRRKRLLGPRSSRCSVGVRGTGAQGA